LIASLWFAFDMILCEWQVVQPSKTLQEGGEVILIKDLLNNLCKRKCTAIFRIFWFVWWL